MFKLLPIFLLVAIAQSRSTSSDKDNEEINKETIGESPKEETSPDLDLLISEIFGEKPKNKRDTGNTDSEKVISTETTGALTTVAPAHKACQCVHYYLCKNFEIKNDNPGLLDLRIPVEETCDSYLDLCCDPKSIITEEEARKPVS